MHLATQNNRTTEARFGSIPAADLRGHHGGTCFDCGRRQGVGRRSTVDPSIRRQVIRDDRTPRLARGHEPPHALQKKAAGRWPPGEMQPVPMRS
jgi:hypothetical protein